MKQLQTAPNSSFEGGSLWSRCWWCCCFFAGRAKAPSLPGSGIGSDGSVVRCPGLEAFAGLSQRLRIGLLGDVATRRQDVPRSAKVFSQYFLLYHCIMSEYDLVCILHADVLQVEAHCSSRCTGTTHKERHKMAVAAAALDQSAFLQDALT